MDQNTLVIYIITHLELGGAQKVCLSLFEHFSKKAKTKLITGSYGQLFGQAEEVGPVIKVKELVNKISLSGLILDLQAFFKIYSTINADLKRYDKVIVHTHCSKAGIIGRWAAWMAGCKQIIHTVHGFGFNPYQNIFKQTLIWLAEFFTNLITTKIIFVSKKDQSYAQRKMWTSSSKTSVIRASPAHLPTSKPRPNVLKNIVTVGTISCFKPQKNLFDLLNSFKTLIDRLKAKKSPVQTKLEIIGDGKERKKIEQWIEKNHLKQSITLRGWVNNPSVFLKSIDIFAMSSLWEGLPCAVVEAQMFKVPVVAYNVGGISEVIRNGENGFLIKPGDFKALSNKLDLLVGNKHLRAKMSDLSQKNFEFSKTHAFSLHEKLYKKI